MARIWWIWMGILILFFYACNTGIIETGTLDSGGIKDQANISDQKKDKTNAPYDQGSGTIDLTAKAGDPCTFGKCVSNLICMANVCHAICSTDCGDKAPECKDNEGCDYASGFSNACYPGTAKYLQACGNGVRCVGGYLCVTWKGKGARCLQLSKYGCPPGVEIGDTSSGCKVCLE